MIYYPIKNMQLHLRKKTLPSPEWTSHSARKIATEGYILNK